MAQFDPGMEGKRIKGDASDAIYLGFQGKLRWVTSMDVYNGLFGQNAPFETVHQGLVDSYPKGNPLDQVTSLVKGFDDPVYLIDQKQKRWIANPETYNTYFQGGTITKIGSVTSLLADGPQIG